MVWTERQNMARRLTISSSIRKLADSDRNLTFILLLPVLLFFVIWNVVPTLWMVGLSFYNYTMTSSRGISFAGLKNFIDLIKSPDMWNSLSRTFVFVVCGVGIQTVLGVLLGFLFWNSTKMPGRRIALTLLFTPMILAPIAAGNYFRLMLDPSFGVLNYIFKAITGLTIDFLHSPATAMGSVLFVDIWMWTPFMTLMTLAALGSVPKAELEAASVDRLTPVQKLLHIVWPHGKYILMLGILLRTIDSFKAMDLVFKLTEGGPGNRTEFIGLALYRRAFVSFNMGSSSAMALVTLLIAIAFTSIYLYVLKVKQREE
jgi:multiple sugar transport system permease protein